jgi:hypothetical protein
MDRFAGLDGPVGCGSGKSKPEITEEAEIWRRDIMRFLGSGSECLLRERGRALVDVIGAAEAGRKSSDV